MSQPPRLRDAAALGFASSLGPFATSAYMPGFHHMAEDFGVGFVAIQQSLTIYLFTFAFFSLVAGTVSDSFGRKPTILGGMLLFAIASIGALLSQSLWALYFWRFIQGVGAAVGQVVTQAIVRDRWEGAHAASLMGMIAFFFAASPAAAPVIGGAIIIHFGWHAVFIFLCCYALLIALFTTLFIPESLPKEARARMNLAAVATSYGTCLTRPAFMCGALSHGVLFMGGILYAAGSADFVIKVMGLDVDSFGWLTLPTVVATLLGAWFSARLSEYLRPKRMLKIVSLLTLAAAFCAFFLDFTIDPGFPLVLAGPVLYSLGMSLMRPVMMTMNLDYFPKNRGMAAAVQQFCITASYGVSAAFWVPLVMGEAWKYALCMTLCIAVVCLLWMGSMRLRASALAQAGVKELMD